MLGDSITHSITSAHLMRKVATTANKASKHANIKRWENIVSAMRGLRGKGLDWCHNSTILFSLLCLPFSFLFTSLWVTWLYLVIGHISSHMMGHLTYHMMRAHDQSPDHGLILLCTWVTMTLYFVFHLFLAYDSLYLISDSPGSCHIIDSYCHIIPYSMMSLHTCTYLFLVHL